MMQKLNRMRRALCVKRYAVNFSQASAVDEATFARLSRPLGTMCSVWLNGTTLSP